MQSSDTTIFTRSDLVIRPAARSDRAALEAIAAQTWGGEDYLSAVLDRWFEDEYDGFFVATLRDAIVGTGKITCLDVDEWWLEGLRVAPDYYRHGIGRIMYHFLLNHVRRIGQGTVGFSTSTMDVAVHRLAAETGFERVATYRLYTAPALSQPVEHLCPLGVADRDRILEWLRASAHFVRAQQSFEWDWKWYRLTEERLVERLAQGLVYAWYSELPRSQWTGLVITNPVEGGRQLEPDTLKMAYCDAPIDDLPALAEELRRVAASQGCTEVRIKLLDRPERLLAFERSGYADEWDGHAALLYRRDVSLTSEADVRVDDLPPVAG